MKNIYRISFPIILLLFFISNINGQVEEREALMSLGDQNAISLDVEKTETKKLTGYFRSFFKEYGKVKENRKAKEWYISGAKMKTVSKEKVDAYAKIESIKNGARLNLWIDNGTGFVSSDEFEDQYNAAAQILNDFGLYVEKSMIEEELKAAEKNLAKVEREAKQLVKENEKYHKTIEEAQKRIALMEESIAKNLTEQESKTEELQIHKEGIIEITERLENVGKTKN